MRKAIRIVIHVTTPDDDALDRFIGAIAAAAEEDLGDDNPQIETTDSTPTE